MGMLSYTNESSENREARKINLDVPDDMNIFEYKIMCVRLASAMGYTDVSIKKAFGSTDYESESDREFKKFLQSITELTGSIQHYHI
jgi:hypothetical protein